MKTTLNTTTHRGTYNKLRKQYLEATGEIHCAWCAYHNGDNLDHDYYGEVDPATNLYSWTINYRWQGEIVTTVSYPNWKLRYKGRKSWDKTRERKNL